MTEGRHELSDGWMRFWGTFAQPWPVVIGFLLAELVGRVLFAVLAELFKRASQ